MMKYIILAILIIGISCGGMPLKRRQIRDISEHPSYENVINGAGRIDLHDISNFMYTAEFQFGKKDDGSFYTLPFDIDTGSGVLWSYTNSSVDPQHKCIYDCAGSTTQQGCYDGKEQSLYYGSGQLKGREGTESVAATSIGMPEQTCPMLYVNYFKGSAIQACGLMGANNNRTEPSFIDISAQNGAISDAMFAFDLANPGQTSSFYIGSESFPQGYGVSDLEWMDAVNYQYWAIPITKTHVGKHVVEHGWGDKSTAVIDSGTTASLINENAYEYLVSLLQNHQDCTYQRGWYCQCSAYQDLPDITFEVENEYTHFPYKAEDYLIKVDNTGEWCMVAVSPTNYQIPFMLLGDVFMRNYFVAYDKPYGQYGRIGLKEKSVGPENFVQNKIKEMKDK